jgi:polysaccharide export outer membrane protein
LADRSAIAITRNGVTTTVSLPQLTGKGINPAQILLGSGDLVRVLGREESKEGIEAFLAKRAPKFLQD